MALGDLTTLKSVLNITGTSKDVYLNTLLTVSDGTVRRYVKRTVVEQAVVTEYHNGSNAVDLPLYNTPIYAYDLTGNLTANSATRALPRSSSTSKCSPPCTLSS